MATLQDIETLIETLDRKDREALRQWMDEYEADEWDRQIERDFLAGKMDAAIDRALKEHREGRSRPLP